MEQQGSVRRFCSHTYLAADGAGLQQPIAKIARSEIMHWYQHLIYANERASEASLREPWTPQIWPHFAAFVLSTHCCGRLRLQSRSSWPTRRRIFRMDGLCRQKRNVRDTMLRYLLSITVLLAAFTSAFAEERSGTAEEQKACTRDVQKFCRHVIDQGDFTILACLKENRPKISEACDSVLKNHNQ
jgi:Cysteine rich repeat